MAITNNPTTESKLVILRGIQEGNRFYTTYHSGDKLTQVLDGTTAYQVLGYCSTSAEAQVFLFGRSYL